MLVFLSAEKVSGQVFFESDTFITISADARLNVLLDRYQRVHKIRGYRIQITSSSQKDKAKKTQSKFVATFPDFTTYESYQQPFFTIKIGDFLTKIEAEKVHRMIKEEFTESFIVPDFIKPSLQHSKDD